MDSTTLGDHEPRSLEQTLACCPTCNATIAAGCRVCGVCGQTLDVRPVQEDEGGEHLAYL